MECSYICVCQNITFRNVLFIKGPQPITIKNLVFKVVTVNEGKKNKWTQNGLRTVHIYCTKTLTY